MKHYPYNNKSFRMIASLQCCARTTDAAFCLVWGQIRATNLSRIIYKEPKALATEKFVFIKAIASHDEYLPCTAAQVLASSIRSVCKSVIKHLSGYYFT